MNRNQAQNDVQTRGEKHFSASSEGKTQTGTEEGTHYRIVPQLGDSRREKAR